MDKQKPLHLGFLTAVEAADHGFAGGLLVTNHLGRPLEFQCTLPVKANRTQEILYGPTLVPFLLGELIGRTLFDKAGVKPHLVLVTRDEFLQLREYVSVPVAVVASDTVESSSASHRRDEGMRSGGDEESPAAGGLSLTSSVRLGMQTLRLHAEFARDADALTQAAKVIPAEADLSEPFERVREALQETLRTGAAA